MAGPNAAGAANDYEIARAARIAENRRVMQEMGLQAAAEGLRSAAAAEAEAARPPRAPRGRAAAGRKRRRSRAPPRRSGRLAGEPAPVYNEAAAFAAMGVLDRLDALAGPRRRRRADEDGGRAAGGGRRGRRAGGGAGGAGREGPFDSGRGVRLQGGRVYDSRYGVTCHWCRQKTLEEHVECTAPDCGGGVRLRVSFCGMCLRNRHGEDIAAASASGAWVCPACRGSCGDGCASCCNCGPCRKRAGLAPTHQMVKEARLAGFANVHDYLVHRATGESAADVAARKARFPWGAWVAEAAARAAAAEETETESEAGSGAESEPEPEPERESASDSEEEAEGAARAAPTPAAVEAALEASQDGRDGIAAFFAARRGAAAAEAASKPAPSQRKLRVMQRLGLRGAGAAHSAAA